MALPHFVRSHKTTHFLFSEHRQFLFYASSSRLTDPQPHTSPLPVSFDRTGFHVSRDHALRSETQVQRTKREVASPWADLPRGGPLFDSKLHII